MEDEKKEVQITETESVDTGAAKPTEVAEAPAAIENPSVEVPAQQAETVETPQPAPQTPREAMADGLRNKYTTPVNDFYAKRRAAYKAKWEGAMQSAVDNRVGAPQPQPQAQAQPQRRATIFDTANGAK